MTRKFTKYPISSKIDGNNIMASSALTNSNTLKFGWSGVKFSIKDKPLHWCEYGLSDYEAQITEIHPYDDADYYWAKIHGNIADFIQGHKVKSSMTLPVYVDEDYEDEVEYLDTIIDIVCRELRKLNKNISPRMMHN